MRRLVGVVALAAGVLAGCPSDEPETLPAGALVSAGSDCRSGLWASQAISDTGIPLPDGWELALECGGDDFTLGSARDGVVTIYVDQFTDAAALQWTYAHEIGHAHDHTYLTDSDREQWRELRGLSGDWWHGDVSSPVRDWADIPAEDFAEVYAHCHTGQPWSAHTGSAPAADLCALTRQYG